MAVTSTVANLVVQITANTAQLSAGLATANQAVTGFAGSMTTAAQNMTHAGTVLSGALTVPIIGGLTAAGKAAVGFDQSLRAIQTIGKQSDEELAALGRTLLSMSTDTTQTRDSAIGLADAFYFIQGSGFAGADAMTVLQTATKAASAGLTDTASATQAIIFALNAYGLSADRASYVSDIMFRTMDRGVITFEDLAAQFGDVTATGAIAGVSLDELGAAVATLTKGGISGAEAMTALNQLMLTFVSPSKAAVEAAAQYGIELSAATLKSKGLVGALAEIIDKTGGGAEAMGEIFQNVRAFKGAVSLARDDLSVFNSDLDAMRGSAGATGAAFDVMSGSLAASMANIKNLFSVLGITLGNEVMPIVEDFLSSTVKPLIQAFISLPAPVKETIVKALMLAAALGPVLVVGGSLIRAITSLASVFKLFGGVAKGIGSIIGFLGSPAGPIILLIGAIALLAVLFVKHWDTIRAFANEACTAIEGFFSNLGSSLVTTWNTIKDTVTGIISGLVGWISNAGRAMIEGFANGIRSAVGAVVDAVSWVLGLVRALLPGSDAERGPLSDLFASGKALPETFARGILANAGLVAAAGRSIAGLAATGPVPGAHGPAPIGAGVVAGAGANTVNNNQPINVTINNPVRETSGQSVMRTLRTLGALGVLIPSGA